MKRFIVSVVFLFSASLTWAQLRLPNVFGDHMVLQQQSSVPIWGWAGPGEELTITASWNKNDPMKVKTPSSGNWKVIIKTPVAGGPHTLSIKGNSEIVIQDILIGEVWLCSGQSNMEWSMTASTDGKAEIPAAAIPSLRLFRVNRSSAEFPQVRGEGQWQVCSPQTVAAFSAVGYFFGKKLGADLKVPVGLISSCWGGTPAEAWTPREMVEGDPDLKASADLQKEVPWGPTEPGVLYNSMIHPLVPYGIAGVIWYQGEANTIAPFTYQKLMKTMIDGWRAAFNKEFPFYYVQIAPFKYGRSYEGVLIRDQQSKLLGVPGTGMVIISDKVEDVGDIHPKFKKPVGERLANLAEANTYKRPILGTQSPVYKSMTVEKGGKIRVSFDHAEIGLVNQGGDPNQFMIAGDDKKFVPAMAKIDGSTVVVSAKTIKNPVAVRFCWDNTSIPNLFNKEFLPVSAFRTDDWELEMNPAVAEK